MKKILTLVIALASTCMTFGQTMKEIPVHKRFHTISETGKYMITDDQAYVGIYNTETDEFDETMTEELTIRLEWAIWLQITATW